MPLSPIQLETRIQELVEGVLDEAHWPEVRAALIESAEARRTYAAYVRMHAVLDRRVTGLKAVLAHESLSPVPQFEKARHRKSFQRATLAAAAALGIAAVIMATILLSPPPPPLAFEASPGSEFNLTHAQPDLASDVPELHVGSRVVLRQGVIDLKFATGVHSIIRGPADFTLTSENRLQLDEGIGWFRVPRKAVGFEVRTDALRAIDLGTRFGVISKPGEPNQVHVFEGRVEVAASSGSMEREVLTSGQARKATVVGTLAKTEPDPKRFLTKLPDDLPYLHWSFDEPEPDQWKTEGSLGSGSRSSLISGAHTGSSAVTSGPGRFGRALVSPDFDSFLASDWIGPDGNSPFTLAYWLKVEPGSEEMLKLVILGWGTRVEAPGGRLAFLTHLNPVSGGNAVGTTFGDVWWRGVTPIDDGRWHHHAIVHTGRRTPDGDPEVICYLDGRREGLVRHEGPAGRRDRAATPRGSLETVGPSAAPVTFFASDKWQGQANPHDARISLDEVFLIEGSLGLEAIRDLLHRNHHSNFSKDSR
jgi:hypothetical protein